jgi:creatinine amidohydrolase
MQALREGWVWTQRDWLQATDDTGIGDPQYSTAAKGQRCLEDVASKIASFLLELAAADLNDLYEA